MDPLRVAVVGSGPAGFYAADALLKSEDPAVEVDLIDRLPTPWGLVRLGVAPDHENIKAVSRAFEKTAARPGLPLLRQRRGRARPSRTRSCSRLYDAVVYTVGAQTDRRSASPARISRLVARDRVRRLVQRPPRLPGPRVRPRPRAGRRDRERQRRDRLRPHARADRGGARADRHDRRGDRRDRRLAAPRDRDARPPRPGAGGIHAAGAAGARRARRRGRRSSTRPTSSSTRRARRRSRTTASARGATSSSCASTPHASRRGSRGASSCASSPRRSRSSATSASRRSRSCGTSSSRRAAASSRGRPARPRRSRAGSSCAASATAASRCPACRSTSARGAIPNDGGRVCDEGAERTSTAPAGSSAARAASSARTRRTRPRRSSCCSRTRARGGCTRQPRRGRRSTSCSTRAGVEYVDYAGWQAIDAAERAAASRTAGPRVKLTAAGTSCSRHGRPGTPMPRLA